MTKRLTKLFSLAIYTSIPILIVACGSDSRINPPTVSAIANPPLSSGTTSNPNASYTQQVLDLVNQYRAANGAGALTLNSKLTQAAQDYALVMANAGVMSHTGPDGSTPDSRINATGYQWSTWGENIAYGYSTPSDVMNAWMNSAGHRANILNVSFKEIGIGYSTGSGATPYWVQDFGTS